MVGSVGRRPNFRGSRVTIDTSNIPPLSKKERRRRGWIKEEGEIIIIHGPNVMKGYYKRPEENAAVFTKDGGFRTGDSGYIDPSGYLYITGRIKEPVQSSRTASNVVPSPIEEQLKLSPFVANAMGLRRQQAVQRGARRRQLSSR